jgi:hypothetical protein
MHLFSICSFRKCLLCFCSDLFRFQQDTLFSNFCNTLDIAISCNWSRFKSAFNFHYFSNRSQRNFFRFRGLLIHFVLWLIWPFLPLLPLPFPFPFPNCALTPLKVNKSMLWLLLHIIFHVYCFYNVLIKVAKKLNWFAVQIKFCCFIILIMANSPVFT